MSRPIPVDNEEIVRRARSVVELHDRLIDEGEEGPLDPADAFERWCQAIDALRAVLPEDEQ